MKCPFCLHHFHENWQTRYLDEGVIIGRQWLTRYTVCARCERAIIELQSEDDRRVYTWRRVEPGSSSRNPVPTEVPEHIADDYEEAASVLHLSLKASATLSRRCLQTVLREQGYDKRDLAKQIDALLDESDPHKALPSSLRTTVDAIRNLGNFSAHAINDTTTLQIIDVSQEEAEWCLDILDELFDHYYVKPAAATARAANLNAKLAAAGKPPVKT